MTLTLWIIVYMSLFEVPYLKQRVTMLGSGQSVVCGRTEYLVLGKSDLRW